MERTELAWAAGFWDGEGSAYLVRGAGRVTHQPHARVNQAGVTGVPEVLVRFERAVGVGRVDGPIIVDGKEPLYRWEISSRDDVRAVFDALRPWLGTVKRSQFCAVLGTAVPRQGSASRDRDESIAWAAGLFDGEGSTCLVRHGSHAGYFVLEANISQSSRSGEPEVLRRFRETFGLGHVYGPYAPADRSHAPVYKWRLYRREHIQWMIAAMGSQLGPVKRAQAAGAIATVLAQLPLPRGNPAWGNRKTYCARGHRYDTARLRPFKGRGKSTTAPRPSHQCLACVREDARERRRMKSESGGRSRRSLTS